MLTLFIYFLYFLVLWLVWTGLGVAYLLFSDPGHDPWWGKVIIAPAVATIATLLWFSERPRK